MVERKEVRLRRIFQQLKNRISYEFDILPISLKYRLVTGIKEEKAAVMINALQTGISTALRSQVRIQS
jgi:hypothetical protein